MGLRRHARVVAAAALACGSVVEALLVEEQHVVVIAVSGVLLGAAVALRAPAARAALQAVTIAVTGVLAIEPAGGLFFGLALLAGAGSVSASLGRRPSALAFAAYAAALTFSVVMTGKPEDAGWAIGVFLVPPFVAGQLIRGRQARLRELERLTRELTEQRSRTAQLAAEVERGRIARDIRAVLADGLADMTARAEKAAAAPAPEAFADLQAAGTATASELRRLLRLLH